MTFIYMTKNIYIYKIIIELNKINNNNTNNITNAIILCQYMILSNNQFFYLIFWGRNFLFHV